MHIDRGAAAREKKVAAERERAAAAFIENERAKKARYENLTIVIGMSMQEFRGMREQPLFDMPQTSTDPNFWRKEQELVMKEIYEKLSAAHAVCVQKVLNLTALSTKPSFQDDVWIVRNLGLEPLMVTQQNYSIKFVQQFFATV